MAGSCRLSICFSVGVLLEQAEHRQITRRIIARATASDERWGPIACAAKTECRDTHHPSMRRGDKSRNPTSVIAERERSLLGPPQRKAKSRGSKTGHVFLIAIPALPLPDPRLGLSETRGIGNQPWLSATREDDLQF